MPQKLQQNPDLLTPTGFVFDGVPLYRGFQHQAKYLAEELIEVANGDYDINRSGLMPKIEQLPDAVGSGLTYGEGDRDMVMRWLSKLPNLPPRMLKEISEYCIEVEFGTIAIQSDPGQGKINLTSSLHCHPKSTRAMFAYMMAALLDAGYGENFGKCPECGKWFFDIPSGRSMKKYCNPKHAGRFRSRKHYYEHKK